jgi:hypothetical protein
LALPASQSSTAPPAQAASHARAGGAPRPDGASPGAKALAPKASPRFLALFRKKAAESSRQPAGAGKPSASGPGAGKAGGGLAAAGKAGEAGQAEGSRSAAGAGSLARRARRAKAARASALQAAMAAPPAPGAERKGRTGGATEGLAVQARGSATAARGSPSAARDSSLGGAKGRRAAQPPAVKLTVIDQRSARAEEQRETRRVADPLEAPAGSFERLLRSREAGHATQGSRDEPAVAPTALPRSLQERLVPQIVQHAGIILRDGGEGEIRLVLRPENLGSVRIRLQLGERSLEGRIVVDNRDVKELLDANLEQLKSALRQEGYASANIDVTVSGGRGERREQESLPAVVAAVRPAEHFEAAIPAFWDPGFTTVNLFV